MSPTLAVSPLSPERACASLSSLIRITFIKRASDLYAGRRPAPVELVRVGRACAASSLDASPDECLPREREPVESYHDERVRDLPFADERGDFRERREADDRLLRPAEHRLAPELDAAREERVNPVLLNRGVGPSLAEEEKLCGRVAGLFEQLAGGGLARRRPGVTHPAGNFERALPAAVPVLLDEHDLAARRDGHDVDPVRRFDDVEVVRAPVARVCAYVAPHLEDAGVGDVLGAFAPPF